MKSKPSSIVPDLDLFFTNSVDLLTVFNGDPHIGVTNPAWTALLGWDSATLAQMAFIELVHPDDVERTNEETHETLTGESDTRVGFENRIRCRDGSYRWVEWTSRRHGDLVYAKGRDITARRGVLADLDASLEMNKAIFLAAVDLIIVIDSDMRIARSSPARQNVFGYPDEIDDTGVDVLSIVHSDDQPVIREALERVFATGDVGIARFRAQHADGHWITFEARGRLIASQSSSRLAVVICRDVTAAAKEEAELAQSLQTIRAIVDTAVDVITTIDRDFNVVDASPSSESSIGVTVESRRGRNGLELIHPEDRPAVEEALRVIFEEGNTGTVRYRIRHADGHWVSVESRGRALDSAGAPPSRAVITTRDITDSVAKEAALAESLETTQAIFDAAVDGIFVLDRDFTVLETSPANEQIHGVAASDRRGHNALERIHPDDQAQATKALLRAFDHDETTTLRYRYHHADGRWLTLETRGRALRTSGDEPTRAVFIARDVTDAVADNEALLAAKAEAESARAEADRANRAKSEFLSRMSHELRTPLNSVLGFAQILQMELQETEELESIGQIYNAGRHLLDLINEVLDISRVESGAMAVSLEPVSLEDVLVETVDLVRPQARERGITLISHDGHGIDVSADLQRLKQVLLNLLSNAIKYNVERGSVTLDCSIIENRVRISITDTGPGISAASQARLFVPFERLDAELRGIEGTGLGLALSKQLVEVMGGSLDMKSEVGRGSTFWFELALADDVDGTGSSTATASAGLTDDLRAKVLYIEDNRANVELIEHLMAYRPNVQLTSALTGELGLEHTARHQPDLILLDLHLPDISGSDVLRHIRNNPRTANIPVIMLSADGSARRIRDCLANGANDYIVKPIDLAHFLSVIDRYVGVGADAKSEDVRKRS